MSDKNENSNLYTTGEIAKICDVTVRTVQYYDTRGILCPSELSEGGRRLYSENDLKTMKIICFLRELGFPLNDIGKLLSEEHPQNVISILMEQQEKELRTELAERKEKLQKLEELKREIKAVDDFSVESIGDIAHMMENKKKLFRTRAVILVIGIIADIIEVGTAVLWALTGIWWPFAVGMPIVIALCVWISVFYFRRVAYICPECHNVFKPKFKEMFWASHTPKTRRLKCPSCGQKSFCVEIHAEAEKE